MSFCMYDCLTMPPHVGLRSGLGAFLYCLLPVPNLLPQRITMIAVLLPFRAVFAALRLEGTVYILYHQNVLNCVKPVVM